MDAFDSLPPTSALVASICRCSSAAEHANRAADQAALSARAEIESANKRANEAVAAANKHAAELAANTPNPDEYEIVRFARVNTHAVMQVKYPSCSRCEFEGVKTMVFLNVTESEMIRWRRIDPHFRDTTKMILNPREAPPPAARFPGDARGWADAMHYASGTPRKL